MRTVPLSTRDSTYLGELGLSGDKVGKRDIRPSLEAAHESGQVSSLNATYYNGCVIIDSTNPACPYVIRSGGESLLVEGLHCTNVAAPPLTTKDRHRRL